MGLGKVVVGPQPHGFHRRSDVGVGGHDEDLDVRGELLDLAEHLEPVDVGELEVQEDQLRRVLPHGGERRLPRRGGRDLAAPLAEGLLERPADQPFVVNDEKPALH